MVAVPIRWLPVLALLSWLPVAVYFRADSAPIVALSVLNVGLIAVVLYFTFGPSDGDEGAHAN